MTIHISDATLDGEVETERLISSIAADIRRTWTPVGYAAEPYLDAMFSMMTVNSTYGLDSGRSIIRYFLGNAQTWKGPDARRIKAELKALL